MQQQSFSTQSLPGPLQTWLQAKNAGPQDLRFLSLLKTTEQIQKFALLTESFFQSNPSYSEGLQVLEIIVDLILMDRDAQIPPFDSNDKNQLPKNILKWRNRLFEIRNPNTTVKDDLRKAQLESLNWPQGSKIKVERRGDRHGAEFKVFISSSADLTKIIANLESLKNDFPV